MPQLDGVKEYILYKSIVLHAQLQGTLRCTLSFQIDLGQHMRGLEIILFIIIILYTLISGSDLYITWMQSAILEPIAWGIIS